jgi:hypothetical protein
VGFDGDLIRHNSRINAGFPRAYAVLPILYPMPWTQLDPHPTGGKCGRLGTLPPPSPARIAFQSSLCCKAGVADMGKPATLLGVRRGNGWCRMDGCTFCCGGAVVQGTGFG